MAQVHLDIPLIRKSNGKEFVLYLNELQQNHLHKDICQSLFQAVDHEYLPSSIFSIFLPWSSSPATIVLCMRHGPSRSIRRQGIKHFGIALANSKRWESAWLAVGKTEGLIDLFTKISVTEVKALVRAIGCCNHGRHKITAREDAIDELLRALTLSHGSSSKLRGLNERPIQFHYARMVPACSAKFVEQLISTGNQSNPLYPQVPVKSLINTHGELLQKHVMKIVFGDRHKDDHLQQYLEAFLYNQPPKPGPDPRVSASMDFAIRVLKFRLRDIDNNKQWPSKTSEADIVSSVLHRSLRRRVPEAKLHEVIMLGLQLLKAKPELKYVFKRMDIWSKLILLWKKAPNAYEDLLALALHLELGGSQKTIGKDYFKTLRTMKMKPELRWLLLRMYCLHIPDIGIELDTANVFTPLANQPWPHDIFYQLSKDHAVKLLKGLQSANPKYSFLEVQDSTSILWTQNIVSHQNFNVVLLLTVLQRDSGETQKIAEHAIQELQQQAAAARDKSERAQLVKAVAHFAIASGSLDVYSEIVTWQQRYIPDPLTCKAIIGRDVVLTTEGIGLLSGILQPVPENFTLAEIASRVEKANKIMMSFHNAKRVAKREPSFHEQDWISTSSLFEAVISERITRSKDLEERLYGQGADIYTAIWSDTLAMLETLSAESPKKASGLIETLMDMLPLVDLVTAMKVILKAGSVDSGNKDRKSVDRSLERLSYKALIRLAKSEKPELAQPFVLKTILDWPDASSWHRQLLSVSLLNSLSAKDAHDMLLTFAAAIGEKLEEQSYTEVSKTESSASGKKQPIISTKSKRLVKVTTIKYLAQLLDNAEFISAAAALDILLGLFKVRIHRDIRLATLDSLLGLLNNMCSDVNNESSSDALVEEIMAALEKVIPIAGSLNELYPPRQEDWEKARKTRKLPLTTEIPGGLTSNVSGGLPPLMSAIMTACDAKQYPGLKGLQPAFVKRYLLPILWHSQTEHRKWIALFLDKHKAAFTVDDLPPTPLTWLVWAALVEKYPNLIPHSALDEFNKYLLMTIAPPVILKDFNKAFNADANLRSTAEVRHWLSVFGQTMDQYEGSGTQRLVRMIHHSQPTSAVHNGITFEKVFDIVISHASLFLAEYEDYIDIWNAFVNDLRPPTKNTYPGEDLDSICAMAAVWQKTGRLILEKVVTLVLDQRGRHILEQKRSILPSTIKLRLWLLPYPSFPYTSEFPRECKIFITELVDLLSAFLQGETNALHWPEIAKDSFTIAGLLHSPKARLKVALDVGTIYDTSESGARDRPPPALKYVRIVLAVHLMEMEKDALIKYAKETSAEQGVSPALGFKSMVEVWQNDTDEGVREKVLEWRRKHREFWKYMMDAK